MKPRKRVTVLLGGRSAEREVSLVSGAACAKALAEAGYAVTTFDAGKPVVEMVAALAPRGGGGPDVVFNALHGRWGEDGTVQGLLELMQVPYTHSGVLASAVAMHKPTAKVLFGTQGIRTAEGRTMSVGDVLRADPFPRPYVVKPPNEGSSVGVHIVKPGDNLGALASGERKPQDEVLVERYVPGLELSVGVLGEGDAAKAITVTEIRPQPGTFYDYASKYVQEKAAVHVVPAPIDAADFKAAMTMAERAHRALGCRGASRADIRYDPSRPAGERLYLLEVNTQPGMTPMSLVPEQAAHAGMSFAALCARLVEDARCDG